MSTLPGKLDLIPANTRLETNGDGAAFDISASATRTFLCRLTLTDQIEQESLDVSIWGSADGEMWTKKPLLKLPQQFYRGTTKMILDLSLRPETKLIRASLGTVPLGQGSADTHVWSPAWRLAENPANVPRNPHSPKSARSQVIPQWEPRTCGEESAPGIFRIAIWLLNSI